MTLWQEWISGYHYKRWCSGGIFRFVCRMLMQSPNSIHVTWPAWRWQSRFWMFKTCHPYSRPCPPSRSSTTRCRRYASGGVAHYKLLYVL